MAAVLHRLGTWSYDRRRVVVLAWLVVLVAFGVAAGALNKPTIDTFSVPGVESQRAQDLLKSDFPGADGASARLVFRAPEGTKLTTKRYRALAEETAALAREVPQSLRSAKAFASTLTVSKDRTTAFADLRFVVPAGEISDGTKTALRKVAEPARRAGLQVEFSGGVLTAESAVPQSAELIGVGIALVILMVALGTFVGALLPIVTALVGVAIGVLGVNAATGLVDLNSTAPILASMLGLAVGIDYALFIVSRHRQQLHDGMEPRESVALAVGTAGGAVVFAGVTVVIALCGMIVIGIPFLTAMGLAAAGTVVVAVLVALTLLPALLGFAGHRVGKGRQIAPDRLPMGARWATLVLRRPALAILGVVVVLVVVAAPATGMRLALPGDNATPSDTTQHRSYDLLTKGFGPGFAGPLTVVGKTAGAADSKQTLTTLAADLRKLPDVANVSAPAFNERGDLAVVSVTPDSGPDDQATKDLVAEIRRRARDVERQAGVRGYVTGRTALNIDVSDKISSGLPVFVGVIVVLALLLLLLVFRSIAVPIKAVVGFLLSLAAALGAATWVFQDGHALSVFGDLTALPLVSFVPVLLISILFGLAMDYEVFLVSRIREGVTLGEEPRAAIVTGFRGSARVVTAAALIMVGVFSAFMQADGSTVKTIAFALAIGVLADAFLVRMTLVPAVLALLGGHAWALPEWLGRRLPNVDIEGEALTRRGAAPESVDS